MTNTPWHLLGITPTQDEKLIRDAYFRRLPDHHPEEDPDGFRQLRDAYEAALEFARQTEPDESEAPEVTADPDREAAQQWFDDLCTVSQQPAQRFRIDAYESLFAQLDRLSLTSTTMLAHPTLQWATNHRHLPSAMLQALGGRLGWQEVVTQLSPENAVAVDNFLRDLVRPDPFDLSLLSEWPGAIQEETHWYLGNLAHHCRGNSRSALAAWLNIPLCLPLPKAPEITELLLRSYVLAGEPVPPSLLADAEHVRAQCVDAAEWHWLLAEACHQNGDHSAAWDWLQPLLPQPEAFAPVSADRLMLLFQILGESDPEWMPLAVAALRPTLNGPTDSALALRLVEVETRLLHRQSPAAVAARGCINDLLFPPEDPVEPVAGHFDTAEEIDLPLIYAWLCQLMRSPESIWNLVLDRSRIDAALEHLRARTAFLLRHLLRLADKASLPEQHLGTEGEIPPSREVLLKKLLLNKPTMTNVAFQRLTAKDNPFTDTEPNRSISPLWHWLHCRNQNTVGTWLSELEDEENEAINLACQQLGLMIECASDRLFETGAPALIALVAEKARSPLFRTVAAALQDLLKSPHDLSAIASYCEKLLAPLMEASWPRPLTSLLDSGPIRQSVATALEAPDALSRPEWAAIAGGMLMGSNNNSLEGVCYTLVLSTMTDGPPEPWGRWANNRFLRPDQISLKNNATLAQWLNLAAIADDEAPSGSGLHEDWALYLWAVGRLGRTKDHSTAIFERLAKPLYALFRNPQQWPLQRVLIALLLFQLGYWEAKRFDERHSPRAYGRRYWPLWFGGCLNRKHFIMHITVWFAVATAGMLALPTRPSWVTAAVVLFALPSGLGLIARRLRDTGSRGFGLVTMTILLGSLTPLLSFVTVTILAVLPSRDHRVSVARIQSLLLERLQR